MTGLRTRLPMAEKSSYISNTGINFSHFEHFLQHKAALSQNIGPCNSDRVLTTSGNKFDSYLQEAEFDFSLFYTIQEKKFFFISLLLSL